MADNVELDPGTGGAVVAADDVGGVQHQRVKIQYGTDGSATDVSDTNPLPIDDAGGSITVDGSVSLAAAVPAGTNNIGDVDVLTQPGQAADGAAGQPAVVSVIAGYDGTNVQTIVTDSAGRPNVNINGNVPVTDAGGSLTVDGTVTVQDGGGAISVDDNGGSLTVDGTVEIGATSLAALESITVVDGGATISVDDGAGSLTVDNGGTFATQENGGALTALQLIDDTIIADDAAFTVGTTKVSVAGFLADQASTDSVNEGDAGAARMTLDRKQIVTTAPSSDTEGLSIFRSIDLDETEEDVKTSAGKLYGWYLYNAHSAVLYVKLYNATAANVTVGTTTPVMTIPVPPSSGANVEFTNGISFSTAITAAATTGVADNDTGAPAANMLIANLFYS